MTTRRTVDALGTHCPVPVRLLGRAVARSVPGDVLELLADDPLIEVDLPAWCHARGHELLALVRTGDRWTARVRCGPQTGISSTAAPRS